MALEELEEVSGVDLGMLLKLQDPLLVGGIVVLFLLIALIAFFCCCGCCKKSSTPTSIVSANQMAHKRLIEDMPTTRLRAAAQGYVELKGTARLFAGEPIVAP